MSQPDSLIESAVDIGEDRKRKKHLSSRWGPPLSTPLPTVKRPPKNLVAFVPANPNITPAVGRDMSGTSKPTEIIIPNPISMSYDDDDELACFKINELASYNGVDKVYKQQPVIPNSSTSQDGSTFSVVLMLGHENYNGSGSTLKKAKREAASKALLQTRYMKPIVRKTMKARPVGRNSTSELNEILIKKGIKPEFRFTHPPNFTFKRWPPMVWNDWFEEGEKQIFKVDLIIGDKIFNGSGHTPQFAKNDASINAIPVIRSMPSLSTTKVEIKQESESQPSDVTNYIFTVHQIAKIKDLKPEWKLLNEIRNTATSEWKFTMMLNIGDRYRSVGKGNSKNEAKNLAAQRMLEFIPSEWVEEYRCNQEKKKLPNVKKAPMNLTTSLSNAGNPITALVNFCQKAKIAEPVFHCTETSGTMGAATNYSIRLTVGDIVCTETGPVKKAVRTGAAKQMWSIIVEREAKGISILDTKSVV